MDRYDLEQQMKVRLGYEYQKTQEQDAKIAVLIETAYNLALSITRHKVLPPAFYYYVVEAALIGYRKSGKEGINGENMSGYSVTYGEDMTAYLTKYLGKRKSPGAIV